MAFLGQGVVSIRLFGRYAVGLCAFGRTHCEYPVFWSTRFGLSAPSYKRLDLSLLHFWVLNLRLLTGNGHPHFLRRPSRMRIALWTNRATRFSQPRCHRGTRRAAALTSSSGS